MTEIPKIAQHRLRGGAPTDSASHPDANVLTAFAEQALSPAERGSVLGHLALCVDCRDAVILALPAMEPVGAMTVARDVGAEAKSTLGVSENRQRNWFAWAPSFGMRWAALAAGVAVALFAAYVGLEHREKPVLPSASTTQIASKLPPQDILAPKSQAQPEPAKQKTEVSSGRMRTAFAKKNPTGQGGALVARNRAAQSAAPDGQMPAPAAGAASSLASRNEAVEAPVANSEAVGKPSDIDGTARGLAVSVEKAKPPVGETMAGQAGDKTTANAPAALQGIGSLVMNPPVASKRGPVWMISAGLLKRSLDGGQSWQTVLEGERPWLSYASQGQEVWAGGEAGALQHSNDGGGSWTSIAVAAHGEPLDSAVIHINAQYPNIALTTAKHEIWVSSDSGKTWEKK